MKAGKHRCDVWKVAEQCGVKLMRPEQHRPRRRQPRECYSKKTLKNIGRARGEAHLALVLRLIVETNGNATELYSETISAISALLVNPQVEALGGTLFDALDRINLRDLRSRARLLQTGLPLSHNMRVMLAIDLAPMLRGQPA